MGEDRVTLHNESWFYSFYELLAFHILGNFDIGINDLRLENVA